jgi:hypothetical protein
MTRVRHALRDSTSPSDVAARRTVTPPLAIAAAVALQAVGVEEGLGPRHVLVEHVVFNLGVLGLLVAATWALLRERRERVGSAPRMWVLVAAAAAAAQRVPGPAG